MIEYRKTAVTYQGDGNTSVFPFLFDISSADTIHVAIYDTATEITTEITRDYFVDVSAKVVRYPGYAPGQAPAAAAQPPKLPRGKNITIYRVTPIDQLTDLGNKYPLPYIEMMADKLTAILQEHDEMLGRAVMPKKGSGITPKELMDSIFRTGEKVDAAMNAANGSAAHAAASQTAAKSSEDATREMTEQMHAVFANSVTEIKNALSTNYVPVEQLTKSLTGKADCSLGNILESAKTVINDAVIVRSLLAENGYIVFANGLIVQWGYVYGERVTTPDQSISITPLVSISRELFSCGNVNVAGGNADYNWKNKHAIVSTIYNQENKKLNVSSTFFGNVYITRWLLIGV